MSDIKEIKVSAQSIKLGCSILEHATERFGCLLVPNNPLI